jgi:signal transduction histidine kinase
MSSARSILTALETLVLERDADGAFALCAEPPGWLHRLGESPSGDAPSEVEPLLPFLETFLPEAEGAWAGEGAPRVRSGLWTQVTADGEELHLEATALRVGAAKILVIARDDALFFEQVRVLQRARELRLAHDALSREIERRDVLMHCIVHDLAGPLGSMLGALSLLGEREAPEASAKLIQVALEAALRQRQLIREILDTFAAERGAQDLAHRDATTAPDLCAEAAQVVEALGPMASSRGVALPAPARVTGETAHALGRAEPPCKIVGEERRLSRVLYNLVENAIHFTPAGRRVLVSMHDEPGFVRLVVEDEGPGVPPALVPKLFQKFARGRDPAAGTGLGLYFCRITVEAWGGSIGYEPRPGGGARFWARLRRTAGSGEGDDENHHGEAAARGR